MNFGFVCGWCGTDCIVWGEPVMSWWTQKYRIGETFDCWWCDGTNITPPPPWTPDE